MNSAGTILERIPLLLSVCLMVVIAPIVGLTLVYVASSAGPQAIGIRRSQAKATFANSTAQPELKGWRTLDGGLQLAQFETVFWDPKDTISMRSYLSSDRVRGCSVLEVGTGTGIVALTCLLSEPQQVVALDINPNAVANAQYNFEHLSSQGMLSSAEFEVRQVEERRQDPFAVLKQSERFDLILSNPPWEDAAVESLSDYALYDPSFELLRTLLDRSREFLRTDGELLLAYGCRTAIQRIYEQAPMYGWTVETLDDRELSELPEVFLPGMLLRLTQTRQPVAQ